MGDKAIVVFIDDLDRCSDEVVVGMCEAVKLYLDAPGLIFVIGCDLSVVARGVVASADGGEGEGHTYLEKIVQVAHRVPAPNKEDARRLIAGYAQRSGTSTLIDGTVAEILADRTGRNPRRIKRIINSFVLEHHLNRAWAQPPLGSDKLITAILLQHLYPAFYERIVSEDAGADPIEDFLDYAEVRAKASDPPPSRAAWWATVSRTFRKHGMPVPERTVNSREGLLSGLAELEQWFPSEFPQLARDPAFLALLRGVGDKRMRLALRSQLMSRPLGVDAMSDSTDQRR